MSNYSPIKLSMDVASDTSTLPMRVASDGQNIPVRSGVELVNRVSLIEIYVAGTSLIINTGLIDANEVEY